jgi:hypothetical protein
VDIHEWVSTDSKGICVHCAIMHEGLQLRDCWRATNRFIYLLWLVGGWLVGWLGSFFVSLFVVGLVCLLGGLGSRLVGWLFFCLLVGWFVGWLVGRLVSWLGGC